MNKKPKSRNGFIHLYNQEKEGLGKYDIHYINACKKTNPLDKPNKYTNIMRHAA